MIAPAHPLPTALDPVVRYRVADRRRAGQLHTGAGNAAYRTVAGEASGPGTGRRAEPGPARHPQPLNDEGRQPPSRALRQNHAMTNRIPNATTKQPATLDRTTFETSRLLDFCSEKELTAQTGHEPDKWPLVILKELTDNALDGCEEARHGAGNHGHRRRGRNQHCGQRPGNPRQHRGKPTRLFHPRIEPRGIREPDPRRPGQRLKDDSCHAVCA